jgi:hypothetical protein
MRRKSIKKARVSSINFEQFHILFQGRILHIRFLEQPIGTLIGRLPILSGHNYRISGNEESKRHIDLSTENGTIKVKHKIDRESLKSDQLALALIDEDNLSVKTIKIRVNDM